MYFSSDEIKKWDDECERHVRHLVSDVLKLVKKDSINIIDIGSNVGKFTHLISQTITVNDAILFEPVLELHEYAKTKYPQWKHENRLVGDENKLVNFFIPVSNDNLGISRILLNDTRYPEYSMVDITTFLQTNFPSFVPDIIKIDAEGYDIPITLRLYEYVKRLPTKPIIIFEVAGGIDTSIVRDTYFGWGYKLVCNKPPDASRDEFLIPVENI